MTKKKIDKDDGNDLIADLQRMRADFENYRKRVEQEKQQAKESGKIQSIIKLLPVIDTIERAVNCLPAELKGNAWAEGVVSMQKSVFKLLQEYGVVKIDIKIGKTVFNPELHEAISADDTEGETEVISEELQAGYTMGGQVVRHSLVRVSRK